MADDVLTLPADYREAYWTYLAVKAMNPENVALRCGICGSSVPIGDAQFHTCARVIEYHAYNCVRISSARLLVDRGISSSSLLPSDDEVDSVRSFWGHVLHYCAMAPGLELVLRSMTPLDLQNFNRIMVYLVQVPKGNWLMGEDLHEYDWYYSDPKFSLSAVYTEVVGVPAWFSAYVYVPRDVEDSVPERFIAATSELLSVARSTMARVQGYLSSLTLDDIVSMSARTKLCPVGANVDGALEYSDKINAEIDGLGHSVLTFLPDFLLVCSGTLIAPYCPIYDLHHMWIDGKCWLMYLRRPTGNMTYCIEAVSIDPSVVGRYSFYATYTSFAYNKARAFLNAACKDPSVFTSKSVYRRDVNTID